MQFNLVQNNPIQYWVCLALGKCQVSETRNIEVNRDICGQSRGHRSNSQAVCSGYDGSHLGWLCSQCFWCSGVWSIVVVCNHYQQVCLFTLSSCPHFFMSILLSTLKYVGMWCSTWCLEDCWLIYPNCHAGWRELCWRMYHKFLRQCLHVPLRCVDCKIHQ